MRILSVVALSATAGLAHADWGHTYQHVVDLSGLASWDFQGSANNDRIDLFIVPSACITGISWDLNLTTLGSSWAEEVTIGFDDGLFIFSPAAGDNFTVTNMNYSGSVTFDDPFRINLDGILSIEIFESGWDDYPDAMDAFFEAQSTITLHVIYPPAPGTLAAIGLAGIATTRRRR